MSQEGLKPNIACVVCWVCANALNTAPCPIALKAKQAYQLYMSGVGYYYTEAKGIELVVTRGQAHCYPWHMHTRHWTVGSICQGAVCLTTEGTSQRLCQGRHFCIPPYAPHSLCVEPESTLCVTCFDEQGALLLKESPDTLLRHVAYLAPKERTQIGKVISSYKHHDFSCDSSGKYLVNPDALCARSLREIMHLILTKPGEPLGIEQMAAHAGYSQWHFLRAFQKVAGMTPHAFQLLCRLRLLRSLLRADTAASTAAVSAGFADQSHMHKVFKRHHCLTPGAFKKASVRLEL